MMEIYKKQQFPCDYLIANNGAIIMKTDDTVISDIRCDGSLVDPLLKFLFTKNCSRAYVRSSFPCMVCVDSKDCKDSCEYTLETMLNPLQNGSDIDIVKGNMNKAMGLYILIEYLRAKYDDVIVVGDNINDSDMIREFKSYAMENGVDVIKELADYVTPGIAELIEKELAGESLCVRHSK